MTFISDHSEMMHVKFHGMSSGVEKLWPFDCLNINESGAMHMNINSNAHEYSLLIRMSLDKQELVP